MSDTQMLELEPDEPELGLEPDEPKPSGPTCDCIASGNAAKPKQHGADPHAKNCAIYTGVASPEPQADSPKPTAAAVLALMEVLPADFKLPSLIRFVPDARLKAAAEQAAAYALSIGVQGPEGLQRADVALTALRTSQKGITEHFAEPTEIANDLHKRLTGLRAQWLEPAKAAIETVGRRVYVEQKRLEAIEAEARRKAQEEEDRKAREAARREVEAAARAQAPAPVVEELKRQAETAKAPPVARTAAAAPKLSGNSTVERWKATIAGTPHDAELNPETAKLSSAQQLEVMKLLKAILDGRAPLACVQIDWSYLNKRAAAEKSTLQIPGIATLDAGGIRAKGSRAK